MTLLVVMSPCALVLSIPSAILAAIAWGARHGVLFRGGAAIEKLADISVIALDKTGTLTTGELAVVVARGASITAPVVACLTNERGAPLPAPVKWAMRLAADMMRQTASRI
jgi:cation transport ATPase